MLCVCISVYAYTSVCLYINVYFCLYTFFCLFYIHYVRLFIYIFKEIRSFILKLCRYLWRVLSWYSKRIKLFLTSVTITRWNVLGLITWKRTSLLTGLFCVPSQIVAWYFMNFYISKEGMNFLRFKWKKPATKGSSPNNFRHA